MDNGRVGMMTGEEPGGEPMGAPDDAAGGVAFLVMVLHDGMATIEQIGPEGPSGTGKTMTLGAVLKTLLDAGKQAGGRAEQAEFESGFGGGAQRSLRPGPRQLRSGGQL